MSLMGEATIEPGNVLVAAADVFNIRSMNNNLFLFPQKFIYATQCKKIYWCNCIIWFDNFLQ